MLTFDFGNWNRDVRDLDDRITRQVPFAASRALNKAVTDARTLLVTHTWPSHVTVRNKSFIGAALRVEFATKWNLKVAITDAGLPGRAHLGLHADGGVKAARGSIAIPSSKNVRVGASGVVASQRPRVLPNSFRKGNEIFQRTKQGKEHGMRLMFTLRPAIYQRPDVPFREDFEDAMANGLRTSFAKAFADALGTRRR